MVRVVYLLMILCLFNTANASNNGEEREELPHYALYAIGCLDDYDDEADRYNQETFGEDTENKTSDGDFDWFVPKEEDIQRARELFRNGDLQKEDEEYIPDDAETFGTEAEGFINGGSVDISFIDSGIIQHGIPIGDYRELQGVYGPHYHQQIIPPHQYFQQIMYLQSQVGQLLATVQQQAAMIGNLEECLEQAHTERFLQNMQEDEKLSDLGSENNQQKETILALEEKLKAKELEIVALTAEKDHATAESRRKMQALGDKQVYIEKLLKEIKDLRRELEQERARNAATNLVTPSVSGPKQARKYKASSRKDRKSKSPASKGTHIEKK